MFSNYTFLNDHSYSLRPVIDDNDNLSLNKREDKTKKRQRSSNRTSIFKEFIRSFLLLLLKNFPLR